MARADDIQFDQATSFVLGDEAEAHMDFRKQGQAGEKLMPHLAQRYEEMTQAALAGNRDDPAALNQVVNVLIRQLSVAQADLFALKSLVLGRDKMALTRDWEYSDPMQGHAALLGRNVEELRHEQGAHFVIPNPGNIIGYGWHPVEEKDNHSWCWSGPQTESLLLIPRLFTGPVDIEMDVNLLTSDVMPETASFEVDGVSYPYQILFSDDIKTQATLRVQAEISADKSATFALKLALAETFSPHELWGKHDRRKLGLCLRRLTVRPVTL